MLWEPRLIVSDHISVFEACCGGILPPECVPAERKNPATNIFP